MAITKRRTDVLSTVTADTPAVWSAKSSIATPATTHDPIIMLFLIVLFHIRSPNVPSIYDVAIEESNVQ